MISDKILNIMIKVTLALSLPIFSYYFVDFNIKSVDLYQILNS